MPLQLVFSKLIYSTTARAPNGITDPLRPCRPSRVSWVINVQPRSTETIREEDEAQLTAQAAQLPSITVQETLNPSVLQFTRLQQTEQELSQSKREFREFMAREAVLDEEYWTAAWLRAESHWENQSVDRYTNNYKRKFAEQEFNAIKRRCRAQHGETSTCIVTVKKGEGKMKHTALKSVVGTLDLSIRRLLQGESYPGERVNPPLFCSTRKSISNKYGYIANLCVSNSARRKGIATNMMLFAMESAKIRGIERVFVHVHRDNAPAQQLYQNIGFQIMESASSRLEEEMVYLLYSKV